MISSNPSALRAERSRKRRFKACDACYQRKIKCDAEALSCDWCLHHGTPCTFDRPLIWNDKRKTEKILRDRLSEDMKKMKKKQSETSSQDAVLGCINSAPSSLDGIYHGSSPMGEKSTLGEGRSESNLVETLQEICPIAELGTPYQTPQLHITVNMLYSTPSDTRSGSAQSYGENQRRNRPVASSYMLELPEARIVQECVDVYEGSRLRLVLPVIDPELFHDTIELAYATPFESHSRQASAQACIFAFMQFFSSYKLGPMGGHGYDSRYAQKAQSLFPSVLRDGPTLDGLQAFVMQAYLEPLFGNEQSATYYLSHAVQFLFHLRGNTRSHPVIARRAEHLRNLFWLCYTVDKDLALRMQQPPMINDRLCDLSVPVGYVQRLVEKHSSPFSSCQLFNGAVFPVDIRLSKFKSKVHTVLYSANGMRKSVPELLRDMRELDEELEDWRRSLPSEWKITMLFPNTQTLDGQCIELLMLRLHYHSCVTIIHQVSDRCKALVPYCHQLQGCLRTSITLSVEASRSILLYMESVGRVLPLDTFCILVTYSLSAMLTVFNHTRQNPLGDQAEKDLKLLLGPANIILQSLGPGEPNSPKMVDVRQLLGYLIELGRVAKEGTEVARKQRNTYEWV